MKLHKHHTTPFLYLIAVLLTFSSGYGQLAGPGKPLTLNYNGAPDLKINKIFVSENQRIHAESKIEKFDLKPASNGLLLNVDYNTENTGNWDTLPDGMKIWRAAFFVKEARQLALIFSPYHLNKGVKIFLYDYGQKYVAGAFTDRNNKSVNMLATVQVPGSMLILEMQVPAYVGAFGSLGISGIGCDFLRDDASGSLKDGYYGASAECNVDVNCFRDVITGKVKNSVVRIVFDGHERCTGTLINTTKPTSGINYILTAGHCFADEATANSAVFYFDYESPSCNGPDGISLKTVSGATIRANSDNLDFTLLELLEPVPVAYEPYYAGWDNRGYKPSGTFSIHHPWGDVKKISRDDDPPEPASFPFLFDNNTHWRVKNWETGITEPGSSGAPLFDDQGIIVGTLTGGKSTCPYRQDDYYQMFSHCWDDYRAPENQLAFWLDPLNSGIGYLNGYDPYNSFWLTGDTLSNIENNEELYTDKGNLDWGSYSGHNSEFFSEFAEKYTTDGNQWVSGLILNVASNYIAKNSSLLNIKIWNGTDKPGSVIYEKTFRPADFSTEGFNYFEFDSSVFVGQTFFAGYELEYGVPQDTFSTYMVSGRTNVFNTAFIYRGSQWHSLSQYTLGTVNTSFSVFPVVINSMPGQAEYKDIEDDVLVYPNPAKTHTRIMFRQMSSSPLKIQLFNLQGQKVSEMQFGTYEHIIPLDLSGIKEGIYIIRTERGKQINNVKIVILK